MYIEKDMHVKIICNDESILDGKIGNICVINNNNNLDAAIFVL